MLTFPVTVQIRCIQHIDKDDLFQIRASYIGTDRKYSGYEIYADMDSGKLYAADSW